MKKFNSWWVLLGVLILAYLIVFISSALTRHWALGSYYYDLGIMHQAVFNTSRGLFLQLTDPETFSQISRFAIHFDPLMALFAPFYWLFPQAEVLLVGQTAFLASGAIPVFLLTQFLFKKFENLPVHLISLFFALLYLNYFPLQKTNLADFHAVVLVTPLFLWAFYFIETGRYKPAVALLLLCILGKENVGLTVAMIGLYIAVIKKNRPVGLGLTAVSIISVALIFGWIIPSHRSDLHFAENYYTLDIATNLTRVFSKDTFHYLFALLQPLGFVSLLSPLHLIIAAPEWAINILSSNHNMRNLQYHYTALLTPFIFLSAIYGVNYFTSFIIKTFKNVDKNTLIWLIILFIFPFNLFTFHRAHTIRHYSVHETKLSMVRLLQEKFKDTSIPLSATGHLGPYLGSRTYYYNFLFDFAYTAFGMTEEDMQKKVSHYEKADYVIIQKQEVQNQIPLVAYYYEHLITNPKYELVFDKEDIEIYHKKGSKTVDLSDL